MPPPNLLLIVADDHRHAAMSCETGPTADPVRTPRLDALAARGTRFTHACHAGSPVPAVCAPSRAMLHTGRGPFDLPPGMVPHADAGCCGEPGAATLGGRLREAGYATHHVGKWHNGRAAFEESFGAGAAVFFGGMSDPFDVPLHDWDGREFGKRFLSGCHSTEVFSEAARCVLHRHAASGDGRPLFLSVAFTAPHDPRRTHPEYHARYRADAVALPPNFVADPPFRPDRMPIRDNLSTPLPRDPAAVRRELAGYYAMTEHLDHGVGRVLDRLDELGLRGETLVAYTADHGHALGQHGLFGKQNLYDHSLRVPLILAGPNVPAGEARDAPVYQHDLFPTLCEAAGLGGVETFFDSLWPRVNATGDGPPPREWIGSYYADELRCVTDGRQKLVLDLVGDAPARRRFDLVADPWETAPLDVDARDPLVDALDAWRRSAGDPTA